MEDADLVNRFTYHPPPTDEKVRAYEAIRARALGLARYLNEACPDSREKSLAVTHLEDAVMWANASIARHD